MVAQCAGVLLRRPEQGQLGQEDQKVMYNTVLRASTIIINSMGEIKGSNTYPTEHRGILVPLRESLHVT